MLMVSKRTKKIVFSLAGIAVIVLAASAGFANEGGEGAQHADHAAAQMKDLGWRVLNFAVLVGILVWALKKANVKGTLAARQAQIEKDLKEAQAGKAAAEAKLVEYSAKLDQASREIDELHAAIIREGEQEKERIIAEAQVAARKIADQAAQSAEQETLKARAELRAEAARLAVELAAGKLTGAIQKADHDRFVGEYLDKVVQIQ
ncbi:ATP synthase F0 subunit B [Geobacter sp. FeAm09]|uniref:F0F1 ATP synthase subunit B family protein n=1 Tax=Geobacter sp. FeAm09 TaxID=2597769 RepID=UPI0011EF8464|nr:ATP synthase F0 subunit B [Geobacter sp. FeAm09]QEM69559.1 ATP synthase F0 subunit B [Geobacter sp. FeAm09]